MPRVQKADLVYHYGDTFDGYSVVYKDKDGIPISLDGYSARMKVKDGQGVEKLLLTSGDGITIDGPNGTVTFSATPAKMASGTLVEGTTYYYDLEISLGSSIVKTLLKGKFWVDAQITN